MSMKWKTPKDPDEVLDYVVDYSSRMEPGDRIASIMEVSVVEGTVHIDSYGFTDNRLTVWLSGGSEGESCPILFRITTEGGRLLDQTVVVKIKSK